MNGGKVIFEFEGNTDKLEKTTSTVGNIIKGSLASKAIAKGFQAITDNMDSAIARFDTLNNFPNIMKNFGIGANDANEALKIVNKSIQGLPTTLDSAVSAVERFTSKNGDVKLSAKMFAAVNNAIIAGGAPVSRQADALEQLSQAYAKGKPDMMEWKTLNEVMPAQLKQVASAMGMTTDEYGELLRSAKATDYTMDGFMDTVMKLNENGTGEFASFSEQAQGSIGGIGTSLTNLKTAITRGIANAITEINKSLTAQGLPDIAGIIQIATQKINSAFKIVQSAVSKINFKQLFNVLKTLIPVVISLGVAFKSYGAIMSGIKIASKIGQFIKFGGAILSLVPSIKSVNDAMTLLGMAFNANPIVLIIGAIAGLVVGFMYLWKTSDKFRNFWIGLWNGLVNVVKVVVGGITNVFNGIVNFIKKNISTLPLLIINPVAGIFKLLYDNCEGFRTFIDNLVSGFKNVLTNIGQFFVNTWNNLINFIASLPSKIFSFLQQLPYYTGYVIGAIAGTIATFIVKTIPDFFSNLWKNITTFFTSTLPQVLVSIGQFFGDVWNNLVNFVTVSIPNFFTNLWTLITTKVPQLLNSALNFIRQLPSNIWNILVNVLVSIGTWLGSMQSKARSGMNAVARAIINALVNLPKNMLNIGTNIVKGLWNGINSLKNWIVNKVKGFAKGIADGFKKFFKIGSPSKLMFSYGAYVDEGFINGIEDKRQEINDSINGMFDLSPNLYNNASANLSPNVVVNNYESFETDPLGQMVKKVKTFSGGSKNDYNYGMGV